VWRAIVALMLVTGCANLLDLRDVTAPTCSDGQRDGDETDVDCGGSCGVCGDGRVCTAAADCASGACTASLCRPAACNDEVQNGDETDVDCGGTACAGCPVGRVCGSDVDCAGTEVCDAAACRDAHSCLEIVQRRPGIASGVYHIAPDRTAAFDAVCDTITDGGGWALLLKSNGDETLVYASSLWTSEELLAGDDLTTDLGNAKYASFVALPITTLRGELDDFPFTKSFTTARTAREIFGSNATDYVEYAVGESHPPKWSAQPNCRRFGINLDAEVATGARFGWTANQEPDCLSNDTGIGLGVNTWGAGYICGSTECSGDNVNERGTGRLWGR